MKKLTVLTLALGLFTLSANAQFKQNAKAKAIEVLFTPVAGANLVDINGLVYRNFMTETRAFRFGADLAFSTVKSKNGNTSGTTELYDMDNNFGISLRPGLENHWSGTERLSPYFGGELAIDYTMSTSKSEVDDAGSVKEVKVTNPNGIDGLALGVNALAGFNYYFAKNVYLGVEAGFGVGYAMNSKTKTTTTVSGGTGSEVKTKENTIALGTAATTSLRLGWLFAR